VASVRHIIKPAETASASSAAAAMKRKRERR
jgi:hypothetical protein